jgi:dienelactone hydrolase
VVALTALLVAGCTTAPDPPGPATMTISPPAQWDEPVDVVVRGLPPGERTTVTATATDSHDVRWSAHADFAPDRDGRIGLDQPPVAGDYTGADPMGLFGAMAPATDEDYPAGSYDVGLTVTVHDTVVARGTVHRLAPRDAGVTSRTLRPATDGVFGIAYTPADTSRPRPAVLLFGGSEGGLNSALTQRAALLATHGYPTLALAYFGGPGLPATLSRVPLEYFATALAVLRARPGVDPRHVYVLGGSRGGEAALLLGTTYPELVDGVVATVPAATVNSAYPIDGHSAWTRRGREVPFTDQFGVSAEVVTNRAAVIPVERIRGPVLLTCGGLDRVWPSCPNVDDVTGRLAAAHFRYPVTVRKYDDAGHFATAFAPYPNFAASALAATGGTVAGTQTSIADFHTVLLAFLAA